MTTTSPGKVDSISYDFQIRWLINTDITSPENILQIPQNNNSIFWNKFDFINLKRNQIGMVVECKKNKKILGYFIYKLYSDSIEILTLNTIDDKALITHCLDKLKDKLSQNKRSTLKIKVTEDNLLFQLILRDNEFICYKTSIEYGITYYNFQYQL